MRQVPFAVREEIARNIKEMQETGVIQPSSSSWASLVVLVKKKDKTLCFCVDYCGINSIIKSDQFPLPRIDYMFNYQVRPVSITQNRLHVGQLGRVQYFSTQDLAAGYWQIQVDKSSREKTAFITHCGLFEFQVMLFGLTNALAVFQRLMEKVLAGLKTINGRDFTAVYIGNVIFSETLEDHLQHL